MNNYANYYMPSEYISGLEEVYDQMNFINNQMPNQNNFNQDQKLAAKLKVQAGDNMNFNKCNYAPLVNPNNLYDVYGGFIRGNMFPDLYNTYKINKPYDIRPLNKQAEMLTYIDAYCFAAHDLNLYLDTHPNDKEIFELFKKYSNEASSIIREYEQKYGPLFVDGSNMPGAWNDSPWPWENK